jgi:hypothetical protein
VHPVSGNVIGTVNVQDHVVPTHRSNYGIHRSTANNGR